MTEEKSMPQADEKVEEQRVFSLFHGMITKSRFAELYADVFQGVKDRAWLSQGFVTHKAQSPMGTFVIRTLTHKESSFINRISPTQMMGPDRLQNLSQQDPEAYKIVVGEMYKAHFMRLVFSLMQFDKSECGVMLRKESDYNELIANPSASRKIDMLNEMPELIVIYLNSLTQDVTTAFDIAMTELVKNPPTPQ